MNTYETKHLNHAAQVTLAKNIKRKIVAAEAISDEAFDLIYTPVIRNFSSVHWTPLAVGLKASQMLEALKVKSVLDIGSGCGKFCLTMGMATNMKVTGVEQRPFLSNSANRVKQMFDLPNVTFVSGSAFDLDWNEFDCLYFFNPFYENIEPERIIQNDIPISASLFFQYIKQTQEKLDALKSGAFVITYHGFGGLVPNGFTLHSYEACGSDYLRIWLKN